MTRGAAIHHTKILRSDDSCGDLVLEAGVGWMPDAAGTVHFAIDTASPPGRAYQTRMPPMVGNLPLSGEHRYSDFLREHGIVSLVNVPIIRGGAVWGVMEMDSTEIDRFDDHDVRFLTVMANILGVAIERAADQARARAATAAATEDAMAATGRALDAVGVLDMRLHEMQRRMKNNLAVIAAMLQMEQRQQPDAQVRPGCAG